MGDFFVQDFAFGIDDGLLDRRRHLYRMFIPAAFIARSPVALKPRVYKLRMLRGLLTAMREAEESEPSTRAAAMLRIARVLTKIDQAEAERLLDRGLALLAELPEPERSAITAQATCLAACVSPNRAFALRSATSDLLRTNKFLFDMVRHGHVMAAVEYLTQWSEEGEFPYDAARDTMSYAQDDAARLDAAKCRR